MKKLFIAVAFLLGINVVSFAQNAGEWRIRLNADWLVPSGSTNNISGYTDISSTNQKIFPELNATWFFVNRFSADISLGLPQNVLKMDAMHKTWVFSPALTFLYHQPLEHGILPYAGLGANYNFIYNHFLTWMMCDCSTNYTYQNHVGFVGRIGSDFDISKHWFVNVDVKKSFLSTHVTVNTSSIPSGGTSTYRVTTTFNPWLFSAGIGVKL